MTDTLKQYVRQEPGAEDIEKAKSWSIRIVNQKNHREVAAIIVTLMLENMRLAAEVNDHRQARGYLVLPVHQP